MELLLLLSALLSGITGVMGGGREAEAPQVEVSASLQAAEAVVHVAEIAVQQATAFAIVLSIALVMFLRPLARWSLRVPAMARYSAPKDERRRE